MGNLDKPFPFFLNSDRGNFLLIVAISIFTFTFMKIFTPFGPDPNAAVEVPLYSLITLAVLSFNILLLPRIADRYLDDCNWTLRKYIWFNVYNVASISLVISLSHYATRTWMDCPPFPLMFLSDLWKTAAIGIFPLVAVTFILENRMLSQALKAGHAATGQLKEYRESQPEEKNGKFTVQTETRETVELDTAAFLYAQAENNYSELYWMNGEGVGHKLLRLSLKGLEDQIGSDHILRCHRSFLVNLKKVEEVSGNANGYRLHLPGIPEGIPVSRALGKELLDKIENMSYSVR